MIAKWYDSEGEEYADVTADDFVAGIKYAADHKSEMLYIIQNSIKGLNDYVEERLLISQMLALKQSMIIPFKSL